MNRIASRSKFSLILAGLLVLGLVLFAGQYGFQAKDWVVFQGNPHVYSGGNMNCGIVTDRTGTLLMDATDGREYSDSRLLREATMHILGDRQGYISAPAIPTYSDQMVGFDLLNGLYSRNGTGGEAELTLSAEAQKVALEALGDRKGTVGVYNYKTGEILCMVSSPTYDPDNVPEVDFDTDEDYEGVFLNRLTQVSYVPGSIFKLVTTAAALEELPDVEDMTFYCDGSYQIGGDTVICDGVHGEQTLKEALAHSCNSAFAQLAQRLGGKTLQKYADRFKITEPLTFDGITTAKGNFNVADAEAVNVAWGAIGQYTDTVNPCRYMTFMGAIAGGGKAAEPYLVSRVSYGGRTRYQASTTSTGRLMSQAAAETLADWMHNNVVSIYGEGNFPGLTVCAKTGTAQVGGGKDPNATFSGFVMDEQYPLAFIVVVENGGSGYRACIPIISQVLQACVEDMQ